MRFLIVILKTAALARRMCSKDEDEGEDDDYLAINQKNIFAEREGSTDPGTGSRRGLRRAPIAVEGSLGTRSSSEGTCPEPGAISAQKGQGQSENR